MRFVANQDEVVTHIDGTELLDLGGDVPLEMDRILTD